MSNTRHSNPWSDELKQLTISSFENLSAQRGPAGMMMKHFDGRFGAIVVGDSGPGRIRIRIVSKDAADNPECIQPYESIASAVKDGWVID